MPKKQDGLNKSKRVDAVRVVVRKNQGLSTKEIAFKVAHMLSLNSEDTAIIKNVRRDLKELEVNGEIKCQYKNSLGEWIEEFDPELYKNSESFWFLNEGESLRAYSSFLKDLGGDLKFSKVLDEEIELKEGKVEIEKNKVYLRFQLGHRFFSLLISKDSFPLNLILTRTLSEIDKIDFKALENKFGKRVAVLFIPHAKISSFKSPEKPGHAIIMFNADMSIEIQDLNSKNGTVLYSLNRAEADKIREAKFLNQHKTLTTKWYNLNIESLVKREVKSTEKLNAPSILELGSDFNFLIE